MPPTEPKFRDPKALEKALPLICRATSDRPAMVLKTAAGEPVSEAHRDELLAKCKAEEYVELVLDLLAFEQAPGLTNRNFIRFRDGAMTKLGASGKGTPFLRNHDQQDVMARGGTVEESHAEKVGEGTYALKQTVRLTAPWAVSHALRGLLDGVSIGWWPTGPILCSVCNAEVYTKCYHWPGDRVSEEEDEGGKRYVRDRNGSTTVEWIYSSAVLVETSACNVPAVPGAGIEGVRAALSAALPDDGEGDGLIREAPAEPPSEPAPDPAKPPEQESALARAAKEPTMPPENDKPNPAPTLTEADVQERAQKLADEQFEKKLAERDKRVAEARALATELGVDADKAAALARDLKNFDEVKLKLLELKVEQQKADRIVNTPTATLGDEAYDKLFDVAKRGMLAHMSGAQPTDNAVGYFSRLSIQDIGMELLEARGVSHKLFRGMGRLERAKVMLGAQKLPGHTLAAGGMGSSDLSILLGAVFGSRLQQKYAERPAEWKRVGKRVDLEDFTEVPVYGFSNFPPLEDVPEGVPMERGAFKQSNYNVKLGKGGRIISFTWEMMVNDRFGVLEQIINDRFVACLRYERRKFLAALSANKIGTSSTDFFSVGNANIAAATGAPSTTTLTSGFKAMALQKGIPGVTGEDDEAGDQLFSIPKLWLLGAEDHITADIVLGPSTDSHVPTAASGGVTSSMKSLKGNLVLEPWLDGQTPIYNILFADPNEIAAVQYGHLVEQPGPFVMEEDGFEVTGKDFAVVDPFYVYLADPRGAVKITRS